ncbi:MAG: radical SAM protein [Acidobacteriota bacterium]|nr:radical SAM protein [Acidobacteriota bacterium]
MNVLLISTYELGRQPFGMASPAAWLRRAGMSVACLDLSREPLRQDAVRDADFIAFYLPMHTATRLAAQVLPEVRRLNETAHLCFYGLYAPLNAEYLRGLGAQTILGGEFEDELVRAAGRVRDGAPDGYVEPRVTLDRLNFIAPDRTGLPALARYARIELPGAGSQVVGYTEASRGCKHLCRHCPVVPVYKGRFRIVPVEVVLEDIRQQINAGAQHITFGDPDFFNGIRHALAVVTEVNRQFQGLTYDATIKIEHLLKYPDHLRTLRETGCVLVTSAVESVDDGVLALLEKGHTLADFRRVAELCREAQLALSPTFVPFTPWITLEGYRRLLQVIAELGLIRHVAPVQLGIRLLITAGSRLLDLEEVQRLAGPFDKERLVYPWTHSDPRVESLFEHVQRIIRDGIANRQPRESIFQALWDASAQGQGMAALPVPAKPAKEDGEVPYLTEPWYCCAEPAGDELASLAAPQI